MILTVRSLACAGLALGLIVAAPLAAESGDGDDAIFYLRACATAGAGGAPRDSLASALVAIRTLCHAQIEQAYADAEAREDAAHPGADAERRDALHREARRRIDYDLALLIARVTGLEP